MPLAFRAGRSAFAERVSRLLAAHWFRWFNSVAPEAAASPRHPEVIGASPMTGPSAAGYRLAHRLARDVIYQSGQRASLKRALVLPRVSKRLTIGSFGGRGNKASLSISFPAE